MVDISDKFVVITLTQHEARIWATGSATAQVRPMRCSRSSSS